MGDGSGAPVVEDRETCHWIVMVLMGMGAHVTLSISICGNGKFNCYLFSLSLLNSICLEIKFSQFSSPASSHPQIRRKLEDVSAKLDILYNKLRAGSLSGATLQGLHSILQHIWQYDYPACMQVIAGLIAGGSFAEMSDFMPGVKMLLQVAQQQGVYVEYQQ